MGKDNHRVCAIETTNEQPDATVGDLVDGGTEGREFLAELGQRVRNIRRLREMSRKNLAQVSGISERYLAQLEGGAGNLSIMLLRRVAQATASPIEDLVSEEPLPAEWPVIRELLRRASPAAIHKIKEILRAGEDDSVTFPGIAVMVNRIALIGMRGAGKSTVGRLAAEKLGWQFVEHNKEIEALAGLPIAEIFRLYGQDGYRRFEEKALRTIVARPGPMIFAASSGVVAEPVTFDLLLTSFFTVWVRARPEEHMARVRDQGDAPAMPKDQTVEELAAVLTSREPFYARSRSVLDTSGATPEESTAELVHLIEHYCETRCPWAVHHAAQ